MMKLAPYPEYKDSGVSWLGKIPTHWDVKPGMAFISQRKEKNVGMKESTVLSLSYGQIVVKPPEKLHGLVPESFETYQIADPGNIIIRGTDLQNDKTSLRVGKVRNRGIITSAYLCLQANEKINPDYAHLLLHGYDLMKIYYGMGSGLRQNLDFSDFKRLPVLVPSPTEQNKIHKYVESVHSQINKFIRNKRRFIELLKEQKQNVINQAVTRGLNPNVKLKPSGVEWIGDIPEHWEVLPVRRCAKLVKTGGTPIGAGNEYFSSPGFNWYTPGDFKDDLYLADSERQLSEIGKRSVKLFPPNTVMMIGIGGTIGKVSISRDKAGCNQQINGIVPNERVNIEYFAFALRCLRDFIVSCGKFTTMPIINQDETKSLRIPVPPVPEQTNIVLYINEECLAIDQAINRAQREIELMREYRTRLISDVVTGQVDVRGIEVPEVAEDELLALEHDTAESDDVIDDEGDMDETD